jgi:hypothetical protein
MIMTYIFFQHAIKHEKGDPLYFLTTPSTPLKRICKKNTRTPPPGFPTAVHLCLDVSYHDLKVLKSSDELHQVGEPVGDVFRVERDFLVGVDQMFLVDPEDNK